MHDPDENLARMRRDHDSPWQDKLIDDLANAPLIPERSIPEFVRMAQRYTLTPAERRALEASSRGLTNQMIADLYGISSETVKMQLKSARFRLQAKNTTHACCQALRLGLIR
jgi:DNA-binding CsgD family transcriptional regulator